MKKHFAGLLLALGAFASLPAHAQFAGGQILTAAQLNNAFANVLSTAGGTLTGPLTVPTLTVTTALNTSHANITGGTITGLTSPLAIASGGTNCTSASGACLDGLAGFASTGFMSRTGAGAYSFTASTGSGSVVLATSPSIANPTVTGSFTAPGLVGLPALAVQSANTIVANATGSSASPTAIAVPSCSTSSSALNWTSGTGVGCNATINAATLGGATFAAPGAIGGTTAAVGTFTTLTTTNSLNGVAVATCKNAAGDGAIIQAAVNTGKPVRIVGTCVMDSSVTISTPGQEIFGQGRHQTILNQSAVLSTGTFICSTGEPGPNFHDFAVQFTQPDTTNRASLTAYNPAFYCRNTPRVRFSNLYITAAMVAFDLQGNSGGAYLLNNEVSAFNAILILDGSLDTVRVDNLQGFNFGLTTNQLVIYRQSAAPTSSCSVFTGTVGICSGRMDDLKVKDSLFISGGPHIYLYAGTGGPGGTSWTAGPTFGSIEGTSFDTYWGIDSEGAGGIVRITGSYFNQTTGYSAMLVNNGAISCSGCSFAAAANPAISIGASGSLVLSGGYTQLVTGNSFITNNGNLLLTGMMFQNGSTYNTGVITCPSALSCTVVGNALPNSVSSATNFINFTGTKLSSGNYGATNWGSL